MLPFVSLIIPTYQREAVLRATLRDALWQDYPTYDVIVVDQTAVHEPETEAMLAELSAAGKLTWLRVDWASLPRARNVGIRQATGEIVVFVDDDVQMPPDFLARHARHYQNLEIGAIAGRVLDRLKLADDPDRRIEQLPPAANDPAIAWYHLDLVHTVKPQRVLSARGCNMSFRRSLFTQHHLWFDERFRGSAVREESDVCLRLRTTGLVIWYDPEAWLVHLGEETGGCHDLSTRSPRYQISFYHNHFWLGFKNLTPAQCLRFFAKLFDCHVLGNPPCNKGGHLLKVMTRLFFYLLGLLAAMGTALLAKMSELRSGRSLL
ncbi:hormogonium polysaccharide biosynthesis glycosyltransferase HpsN [Thermoleptolyngbya sp. M55_K2018_002]|uniref:hormogonium polysaccharide biosynthesis glycosyltransferase HpsN n=1 Tax=Thermoleptolyngbya sp. M55_K2018_002 TaxID=2747808 RepID=UPI0019E4467E|nr:glycosyltransferase family 2 protein [Thermoleptolyngbya sp. M55_K2018_002]